MKRKILLSLILLFSLTFITELFSQQFDINKDFLLANYDLKPDEDDVHAAAAFSCMLLHEDFDDLNYIAVAGAYGKQGGSYITTATPGLYTSMFGAKNVGWVDAHRDRDDALTIVKGKLKAILNAGGEVFVAEAGQSDFTHDVLNQMIDDGISRAVIKDRVIVVQHSIWNQDQTTQWKLNWVRDNTKYRKIDDGNKGGNNTPAYKSNDTNWLARAKAANNPNTRARDIWREADNVVDNWNPSWKNPTIEQGGVDYSDTVELWSIFNLGNNVNNNAKFWDKYITNTVVNDPNDDPNDDPTDCANSLSMTASSDFPNRNISGFSPAYLDNNRNALAIDASKFKDQFAAATGNFAGDSGVYNITFTSLRELDGESSYKIKVNGTLVGEFQNPTTNVDYATNTETFDNVSINNGDTIQVEFSSHSNGQIPEGNGFAFSRGRWTKIQFDCTTNDPNDDPNDPTGCAALEINGVAAVEAEHFDSMERTDVRSWYVTDQSSSNLPGPDPDGNHFSGASGGSYLEILPDTRVTHGDPLQNGVNFTNTAGQMTIVNYKVKFENTGRYFVWVRAYSSGTEDNGVHVGVDGNWPDSGARLQWCAGKNAWTWESKQRTGANHCGEERKIFIDIDSPGIHTISFSMREDGFEMDKFVLNKDYNKPNGNGPQEQLDDCTLSTSDLEIDNTIQLFPNPALNSITVKNIEGEASIYDLYGRRIFSDISIDNSNSTINISKLPSGMYLLIFDSNRVAKFIKR